MVKRPYKRRGQKRRLKPYRDYEIGESARIGVARPGLSGCGCSGPLTSKQSEKPTRALRFVYADKAPVSIM
jgi:hypothetical protein